MALVGRRVKRRDFGSVEKLPSGHYRAYFRRDGRRHVAPQTYTTVADARAWLRANAGDLAKGTWTTPAMGRLSVAQLAERWLASNPNKRENSHARDQSILVHYILPIIGPNKISRVTRATCQELVDGWSAAGLSASTVRRQAATLRALFSYAVRSDLLPRSPFLGIRLPRATLVDRPVLRPAQLEHLASALPSDQEAMMWVGVVAGLRWSEVAGLTVGDVDTDEGYITVRHALDRRRRRTPPKSAAGTRRLAIPDRLADMLAPLIDKRPNDPDALLFVNSRGGALHYSNWRKRTWLPACQKAGLPGLRFHDLRSMAATAMVRAGVDVKTAQVRLGHANASTTLGIYARATAEADRRAAEAAGSLLPRDGPHRAHFED
ncbi:MAG TPA: tyrosine-type recombinase/integrase [Acidimicrobiales bacterium]|nr:tyrosine-type recombinase/integrase [Acidimicrobiales bacterium]